MAMSLQETKDYLDTLPGVLTLWWFMENVTDENPDRSELFFYCRERVRRYQHNPNVKMQNEPWRAELDWDDTAFRIEHER